MANVRQRENAQALRHRGSSISEIAKKLGASKSTVSYWCRDISLSDRQIRALATKKEEGGRIGRLHAAEKKRLVRIKAVAIETERGKRDISRMTARDLFLLGIGLYWGEGYKSGNEECGFTNSNPDIVKTFIIWMNRVYEIPISNLIARVSVNATHRDRVETIENYWSTVTKISLSQFTKTSLIKARTRKIYSDRGNHFGTLRIKVRRGTSLRRRILGSIQAVAKQIIQ
jgi:transposase-like protein